MPLEVKKQERESVQSLIRRFSKAIKKSGVLRESRKRKFFQRPLSDQAKKKAALKRVEAQKKYEKMNKLGLIKNRYVKR